MYKYKFINEDKVEIHKKGNFIVFNNNIITNPSDETLFKAGYKDMVVKPEPEYNPETQYTIPKYADGDVITQRWEVRDIEIEESEVVENE